MEEKKTENLFDEYYAQDTNNEEDVVMAGYAIYGAYSASSCCC